MSLKTIASLSVLAVTGFAPLASAQPASQEPYLKDSDLAKVGKALTEYFEAYEARKKILEAEADFAEALEKAAKGLRKAPIDDLLASPADMGRALWLSANYAKQRIKKGKMEDHTFKGGFFSDTALEYSLWVPSKYDAKKASYPLIIAIPDVDETPSQHLIERWESGDIRDAALLVAPKMPEDKSLWTDNPGIAAVLVTMREVSTKAAVDFDRIYLAGRGAGVAAAVAIADKFPHRFAGVIGRTGDAGPTAPNNFSNLPTMFAGGGGEATAFEKAGAELGWDNCTVSAAAQEGEIWNWIQDHPRSGYPSEVTLYPGSPFPNRAYWLEIAPGSGGADSKVSAKIDTDANTVTIEAEGLSQVELYLSDALLDLSKPIKIIANGAEISESVPRSKKQFLSMAYNRSVDPGGIYVARLAVSVPAKVE